MKVMGIVKGTLTLFPSTFPGINFLEDKLLMILIAASFRDLYGALALIEDMIPSELITNWTHTLLLPF